MRFTSYSIQTKIKSFFNLNYNKQKSHLSNNRTNYNIKKNRIQKKVQKNKEVNYNYQNFRFELKL